MSRFLQLLVVAFFVAGCCSAQKRDKSEIVTVVTSTPIENDVTKNAAHTASHVAGAAASTSSSMSQAIKVQR